MAIDNLPFKPKNPERFIAGVGTLTRKPLEIYDLPGKSENSHKIFRPSGIYLTDPTGEEILLGWVGPVKVIYNYVPKYNYTHNDQPSGIPVDGRRQTESEIRKKFRNEISVNRELTEARKNHTGFWPFPRFLSETNTFHEQSFTTESAAMTKGGHDALKEVFGAKDFHLSSDPGEDTQLKLAFGLLYIRNVLQNLELLHSLGYEHGDFSFVNSPVRGSRAYTIDLGDSRKVSLPDNFSTDRNCFARLCSHFTELTRVLTKSSLNPEEYAKSVKERSMDDWKAAYQQLAKLTSSEVNSFLQPILRRFSITEDWLGEMFEREKYRSTIARATKEKMNLNPSQLDKLIAGILELENAA